MPQDSKLKKLESVIRMVDESITQDEFIQAFDAVLKVVKDIKATNEAEFDAIKGAFDVFEAKIEAFNKDTSTTLGQEIKDTLSTQITAVQKALQSVDARMASVRNGTDAVVDVEAIIQSVLENIQLPEQQELLLDTPENIRNKLEVLQGEERLDAAAIKNLPEAVKYINNQPGVLTASALYSLADVDVSGITVGQSIKWDGVRWIPYTPSSGSNTVVLDENLITQGSGIVTYTLSHTPAANTLRLYRGGSRITVVNGDYTISGAIITLSSITQTGETLTADYEY